MQVIETGNRHAVEVEQYIALFEPGTRSRPVRLNFEHERCRRHLPLQRAHDASIEWNRLTREPQATPSHAPFTHQRRCDIRRDIDADGEADSLGSSFAMRSWPQASRTIVENALTTPQSCH